ncbi:MAG: hypothetical protein ACD_18C00283G0008 [uncultured bacterium]|nr:MAG: hypothetical protein ACD_18C00283G0008 [uncultured bacterium]OGH84073.1 MAG: hypothetical protein A2488_02260 [Candidatus Magasanikbacteria bacterium RIFOXYC12_FULL_32_21b]OGH89785.1 MAG: hypothetical protein A2507_02580 [Candidatus Magasanikbacteria bacterium RIFOXYD12_FULL_33_17]HAO52606.1 hypothetical protein [Candidatus Magasanikbacteria bacterium]
MKNGLEIQEFFVEGSNQRASHVLLHIAEPITQTEKDKGYFFAIIEVSGSYSEQISQLQQIVDDIEIKYYDEENTNIDNYFESVLQEINQQSHNILQYKDSTVSALVGIIQKRHLILAYHGSPNAYLFFAGKEGLRSTEIIDREETENTGQLFSSVVEGDMKDDDYLYVATPSVTGHFSPDRVRKIIQNRATKQGAMHIQKVLENLQDEKSFGGIVFHTPKTQLEVKRYRNTQADDIGSQESMDDLLNTTRNTADTLSPSLLKNIKDKINSSFRKNKDNTNLDKKIIKKTSRGVTTHGNIETNFRNNKKDKNQKLSEKLLVLIGKVLVFIFTGIFFVFKKVLTTILSWISNIFYLITNKSGKRTIIADRFITALNERRERVRNVSMISKILFIALILLAVIFLSSIVYIKIKENKEAKIAQYENMLQTINDKKDDAEAKLLYGEDSKALEILDEAKLMINNLSQNTDEEKTKYNELITSINEILNKLQKMNNVETEIIADFNNSKPSDPLQKIINIGDDIFAYSEKDKNMYKVNIISKDIETKNHENQTNLQTATTPKEEDKIIFLSKDNSVFEYTKLTGSLSKKDIGFPSDNANITNIAIYNRKLYSLSPSTEQIYKHSQTQTGYDRGTAWITQKSSSLSKAISIAIDGDVFVLTSDAKILHFYGGQEKAFEIQGVHPELKNPTEIWTYADSDYLYLLDPENKRIVLLDKDGNFIEQFTSSEWKKPNNMLVDEDNKVVYVLDDNKIYKFSTK